MFLKIISVSEYENQIRNYCKHVLYLTLFWKKLFYSKYLWYFFAGFHHSDFQSFSNSLDCTQSTMLKANSSLRKLHNVLPIIFSPHRGGCRSFQYIFETIGSVRHFRDDNFFFVGTTIVLVPRFPGTPNIIEYVSMWICVKALWWMT